MAGNLLERERELAALAALLGEIAAGQGRIALVTGEAGIGKTALVERFLAQAREQRRPPARVLWSACEALFTPRPLGPLYDIAQQAPTPLRALLEGDANRSTLFTAVFDELTQAPTLLVIDPSGRIAHRMIPFNELAQTSYEELEQAVKKTLPAR